MKLTRKVLRNRSRPCDFYQIWQNQDLADRMIGFMRANRGMGLAAPQIGISRRLFVMEIGDRIWHCFNPEIRAWGPDREEMVEGCLSFPGESCTIIRPSSISVQYNNASGEQTQEVLQGTAARCFQHEMDHLDGITMWERQIEHAEQS